jgi:hypothetical protein
LKEIKEMKDLIDIMSIVIKLGEKSMKEEGRAVVLHKEEEDD